MNPVNTPERMADAGAASSGVLWLATHALEFMPILQAASLMVAIIAGSAAAYYHITRARRP